MATVTVQIDEAVFRKLPQLAETAGKPPHAALDQAI
jgi:predicted transcriptional regulator